MAVYTADTRSQWQWWTSTLVVPWLGLTARFARRIRRRRRHHRRAYAALPLFERLDLATPRLPHARSLSAQCRVALTDGMGMVFLMGMVRTLVDDVCSSTHEAQLLLGVRLRHLGRCSSSHLPDQALCTRRLSLDHHCRMRDFSWMESQEAARGSTGDMSLVPYVRT